jgi:hypothetical protein
LVESEVETAGEGRNRHSVLSTEHYLVAQGEATVAVHTTTSQPGTPVSTKIVVGLGLFLVAIGGGIGVADHLRGTPAQTSSDIPPAATGFSVPGAEHLLQFVGLLVVGVCVAGFLVVSRSTTRRR